MTTSTKFDDSVVALVTALEPYGSSIPDVRIRLAVVGMEQFNHLLSELGLSIMIDDYSTIIYQFNSTDPLLLKVKLLALRQYIMERTPDEDQ